MEYFSVRIDQIIVASEIEIKFYIYIITNPLHRTLSMYSAFQLQLTHTNQYLRPLIKQPLDLTALFIIEAHLTSLKAHIRPSNIILSLFTASQLQQILAEADCSRLAQQGRVLKVAPEKQTEIGDLQYLGVSVNSFDEQSLDQLTFQTRQLVQTLQEWEILQAKAQELMLSAPHSPTHTPHPPSLHQLKQQLQNYLQHSLFSKNQQQLPLNTETYSFATQIQTTQTPFALQALLFFQYVARWSLEIARQIQDFKALMKLRKQPEESHLQHFLGQNGTESACSAFNTIRPANPKPNFVAQLKKKLTLQCLKQRNKHIKAGFQFENCSSNSTKSDHPTSQNCCSKKAKQILGNKAKVRKEKKCRKDQAESCQCVIF